MLTSMSLRTYSSGWKENIFRARPEFEGPLLGKRREFDADLDGFTITVNIGYRF